jgi:spore photoproduct lyase
LIYKENKGLFIRRVNYGLPFETLAIEEANGCPFDCEYCFLKSYFSESDVVIYTNKRSLFEELEKRLSEGKKRRFYIGEYSEPLWTNRFNGVVSEIIEIFRRYPEEELEIRTKFTEVDFLKDTTPPKNIIFAWSLLPEDISERVEKGVPSVEERIKAMFKTKERGFRVGVRLEPLLFYKGWEDGYRKLIKKVSSALDEPLEMGALRLTPHLRRLIYSKNPGSELLKTEFVISKDGKLRYPRGIRFRLYSHILSLIYPSPARIYMEEDFLIETLKKYWKNLK